MIEAVRRADESAQRVAIIAQGKTHTYADLVRAANTVARNLCNNRADLQEERIAFMVTPGFDYVSTLWGIWLSGGVAVPLCLSHPAPALEHVLKDTRASAIVTSPAYADRVKPLAEKYGASLQTTTGWSSDPGSALPVIAPGRRAMILYTSGTTNLPKGVVSTHRNLEAQIQTLVDAWHWGPNDHTLCVLPLHHVHGIVNVVSCSLWAGARCEFLPEFDADKVWETFRTGEVNVFMAVPTIYHKLIAAWDVMPSQVQTASSTALRKMRLMVSGSAALPVSVMERWEKISGHQLLERYGMTELGMAISNPYDGERRPGAVGLPLPGVDIRLADEADQPVYGAPGEIQVRGENVFKEYWGQPEATMNAFTADGWFRTGDVAVLENGYYRILGRSSMDIIKSGGYKISALEIEEVLRTHPQIRDCAVVGLPDPEWGEVVAAALVLRGELNGGDLRPWLAERIPTYRIPRRYTMVHDLPRNAMGKVTKQDVKKMFEG